MGKAPQSEARGERETTGKTARRGSPTLAALAARVRESLGDEWLPLIYGERVRALRTRSAQFPETLEPAQVRVQHTLLGVELQTGRRRLSCPDLATARYLAVFARLGCREVAVPYDITKISHLADMLESGWQRMLLLVEHVAAERDKGFRTRLRRAILAEMRSEISEAGAGTAVPQFKQDTRQHLYEEPNPPRARRA